MSKQLKLIRAAVLVSRSFEQGGVPNNVLIQDLANAIASVYDMTAGELMSNVAALSVGAGMPRDTAFKHLTVNALAKASENIHQLEIIKADFIASNICGRCGNGFYDHGETAVRCLGCGELVEFILD